MMAAVFLRLQRRDMICCLAGAFLLAVASSPTQGEAPALTPAATAVVLRDQYGHGDSLAAHAGRPQVVLVVSVRRLRRLKDWEVALDRRLEGIGFLRVADVPAVTSGSAPTQEQVAETLRKRVPREVRVLIDVERRWAGELRLDTREVHVLAFDAEGRLVHRARGAARPDVVQQVADRLLKLPGVRRKGATAPDAPQESS
jgi:hypothetical protein